MDLVAEPVGEGGTQRTVDETAGEDRLLAGPSLATEERAGDLARGVHALFDVDGQREEIGTIAGRLGAGGGDEDDGVAHPGGDRTAGERRELADLEGGVLALAARERAGDGSGFSHVVYFLGTNTRLPVPSRKALISAGPFWPPPRCRWAREISGLRLAPTAMCSVVRRTFLLLGFVGFGPETARPKPKGRPRRTAPTSFQRRRPRCAITSRYRSTSLSLT